MKRDVAKTELMEVLLKEHERKFPDWPEHLSRYVGTFSTRNANELTRCILAYLKAKGHHAERVNTTGIPRKQRDGKMKWIPSGSMKGSSDIHAIVNGKFVAIEVKYGKDRQSEAQKKYEEKIVQAGGIYKIIRTLREFLIFYHESLCNSECKESD